METGYPAGLRAGTAVRNEVMPTGVWKRCASSNALTARSSPKRKACQQAFENVAWVLSGEPVGEEMVRNESHANRRMEPLLGVIKQPPVHPATRPKRGHANRRMETNGAGWEWLAGSSHV